MQKTLNEFYDNVDLVEVYPESRDYLKNYWLDEEEYVSHWQPIQDRIFDSNVGRLPARLFLPEFKLMSFLGGFTFVEEDLLLLQACMRELGEQYFVVIENCRVSCEVYESFKAEKKKFAGKPLNFKYPVDIKFEELATGDWLTEVIRGVWGSEEFYVFGESGLWGKYAANDYFAFPFNPPGGPLNILGFKEACAALFREKFHRYMDEYGKQETLYALTSPSLHPAYKEYIAHLY
jgi:hypothetical protein